MSHLKPAFLFFRRTIVVEYHLHLGTVKCFNCQSVILQGETNESLYRRLTNNVHSIHSLSSCLMLISAQRIYLVRSPYAVYGVICHSVLVCRSVLFCFDVLCVSSSRVHVKARMEQTFNIRSLWNFSLYPHTHAHTDTHAIRKLCLCILRIKKPNTHQSEQKALKRNEPFGSNGIAAFLCRTIAKYNQF